jgi:hypothetical protein
LSSTTLASDSEGKSLDFIGFILPDYERRVLVLAYPGHRPKKAMAISMDDPSAPMQFDTGIECRECGVVDHFLADLPSGGLGLILGLWNDEEKRKQLQGAPLTDKSQWRLLPLDATSRVRTNGYFGTVDDHPASKTVRTEAGPNLHLAIAGGAVDLGIPAPPSLKTKPRLLVNLKIRNDASVVVESEAERIHSANGLGSSVQHIYSTSARAWTPLKVPGSTSQVRSFGKWLAFVVTEAQPWAVIDERRMSTYDWSRQRVSPGQTARQANKLPGLWNRRKKADMDDIFMQAGDWFPGILLLYNVDTGRLYRIETGQGDSEVVLVDGSDVYYRVNTTLYRATIGSTSVEGATKIVDDPIIGNVHVAFLAKGAAQ